eukprot:SAG22_NODE_9841_length_567_cov_0.794872_2_plen_68_part_00
MFTYNQGRNIWPLSGALMQDGHHLSEEKISELCAQAKEVLGKESNVAQATAPVTIVGDIHGQLHDFI